MTAFFNPTTFDKAFVRAVEFIDKEGILSSKTWLANEIGITPQALSAILAKQRGLPTSKKTMAVFILTTECKVRKEFLDTNRGPILIEPVELNKDEYPQYSEVTNALENCKKEVMQLMEKIKEKEERLKEKDELIFTQKLIIEKLHQQ